MSGGRVYEENIEIVRAVQYEFAKISVICIFRTIQGQNGKMTGVSVKHNVAESCFICVALIEFVGDG